MNPLVGKKLVSLQLADDKKAIRFVLEDGECVAHADGDCCSETWIEHVSLPTSFPATVLEVADLNLPQPDDSGELKYYGCCIKTDRGDLVIDYRNSSNGYYGGDLTWGDEYFYGGVYGQNISKMEWKDVTADI